MIKKLCIYSFWLTFVLYAISCNKEHLNSEKTAMPKANLPVDTVYDRQIAEVAQAVHQSLTDNQFCKTLKEEVMQRPDGDYEVILKSFAKKMPGFSNTAVYASLGGNKLKSANGTLEVLEKYPQLQIAIPVNAEKWDGVSKLWVLYLPSNYDDLTTKEVPAISPEGKKTQFNIEQEPDFPVIVIGKNERSDKNGEILPYYEAGNLKKAKDDSFMGRDITTATTGFASFTAQATSGAVAVNLAWDYSTSYPTWTTDGSFDIFRDDLTGSGYVLIASKQYYERAFNDLNVASGKSYSYNIRAKMKYGYMESANANIFVPAAPDFLESLSVVCTSYPSDLPQFKLDWKIKNTSNWTTLKIYRSSNITSEHLLTQLPISAISYTDILNSPIPSSNVLYTYRIEVSNVNNGSSQSFKCQEYLSNRINSYRIRMNRISFPSYTDMRDRYEGWPNGNPEWNMEIACPSLGTYQSFAWDGIKSCCQDLPQPTCTTNNWWRGTQGDVLTFHMWEKDNSPVEITLTIGSVRKTKLTDLISVEFSWGASAKFQLGDGNDEVGKNVLFYWNNASNYNFQINDCTINVDQIP